MKKTNKIYIVDAIGIHCGMNYYTDSFLSFVSDKYNTVILSNYPGNGNSAYFFYFYKGNVLFKVLKFLVSCLKLLYKVICDRRSIYVVLSYGTVIDFVLILILLLSRNHIIDVHEVIMQGAENNRFLRCLFGFIYRHTQFVIIHSIRSKEMLKQMGFNGRSIFVPHFEYKTSYNYNLDKVGTDVQGLIKKKINILWFGNITYSKGVDLYVDNINSLANDIKRKLNIIIAGRSLDGVFEKCDTKDSVYSILIRRLNDDEMTFLYTKSDYIILPYRQTSQSGVLEMAFHYQIPVIASDIPYFTMMLSKYPSFGLLTGIDKGSFHKTLETLIHETKSYYKDEDVYNYKHREEMLDFANEFNEVLSSIIHK